GGGGWRGGAARAPTVGLARRVAGDARRPAQAGASRAAAVAGGARSARDGPHAARRRAARAGTPEAVRRVALRVARVLPPVVPVQRARARSRGGSGEARGRPRCAADRRWVGRRGARAGRPAMRSPRCGRHPPRVRSRVRPGAGVQRRESVGWDAEGVGPMTRKGALTRPWGAATRYVIAAGVAKLVDARDLK